MLRQRSLQGSGDDANVAAQMDSERIGEGCEWGSHSPCARNLQAAGLQDYRGGTRRHQLAQECRRGIAIAKTPGEIKIRHLQVSQRTKGPLLIRFGSDVTLGELAQEQDLARMVRNFGKKNAAELESILKAYRVARSEHCAKG